MQAIGLEVTVLLVAESFDRARVDHFATRLHGLVDRVFRNKGLAGTGWSGNQYILVGAQGFGRLHLEGVEIVSLEFHSEGLWVMRIKGLENASAARLIS